MKILEVKTEDRALGTYGEGEAVKFLKKNGYKILERNYVACGHEVDIIAECGDAIAFIEVKTRSASTPRRWEARPAAAVTPKKQQSIIMAASAYIGYHRPKKHARLDIIEVYVTGEVGAWQTADIKHLPAAFDRNTAYKRRTNNR